MATKTALLLNDTAHTYHWGCFATSSEIRLSLEERGYAVQSLSTVDILNLPSAPKNDAEAKDGGFLKSFLKANPTIEHVMASTDCVVVNGEGTLHGVGTAAFNLLYLAHIAKTTFNKPVHAINMSLFPSDDGLPNDALDLFYKDSLTPLDSIVVREPRSGAVAERLGLNATMGFDCLPRFLDRQKTAECSANTGAIVLGGGLGIDSTPFIELVQRFATQFDSRPLQYVVGASAHPALDDIELGNALAEAVPRVEVVKVNTFEDWTGVINSAACLGSVDL